MTSRDNGGVITAAATAGDDIVAGVTTTRNRVGADGTPSTTGAAEGDAGEGREPVGHAGAL